MSKSLPLFQRSPRLFPAMPDDEVEIQSPPSIPSRPTSSLVAVLLPLGFMVLALGLSVAFLATNASYLLLSVPLMLGSGMVGIINYNSERKKYKLSLAEREDLYRAHLAERRALLIELSEKQRQVSTQIHAPYAYCLSITRRQSPADSRHLWERSSGLERPVDPDFLDLRVGIGQLPSSFSVKPPSARSQVGEVDIQYEQAVRLVQEFQHVDNVVVSLPMTKVGSAGLVGRRPSVLDAARALLVQLATYHAPNEVKIVALLPADELVEWEWLRWLPHVWDDERKHRFLAATPEEARALLSTLYPSLQRRALGRAQDETKVVHQPYYLFLFADPAHYTATADTSVIGPLLHLLQTQGKNIGAYSLFLNERADALPSACGAIVDLSGETHLKLIGPPTQEFKLTQDRVDINQVDLFARAMAPIRLKPLSTQADLLTNITLTNLLDINLLEKFPLSQFWKQRDSHLKLEVPLGKDAGGGNVFLNFQDSAHGGDGSHAMVGGTTGTGKTRFLQTMIVLLAAHHHPQDVNFILVDYKGGDLLKGLEHLPHVVDTLANLEKQSAQAVLIERLFVCLEAELRQRRNLLEGRDISKYQQDTLLGKTRKPLSHLFVVIDEFAEMIRNSPDKGATTKRLVSIGATGRSLGVHLVLATQDPSGVVTDDLRTNINIRLCLRMGSRQASMDILRLPDAYENISGTQVGRAYLQTGNNDRFVPFQVAWGGDVYKPGQSSALTGMLRQVALNGQRTPLQNSSLASSEQQDTQLAAMTSQIQKMAETLGLKKQKSPLSPPLASTVFLTDLRVGEPGWNGLGWQEPPGYVWRAPIIGQYDDPSNQVQDPLRLPLGTDGHLAVYGEPGSGKSSFVQTLVTSLSLSYPPEKLHMYLLDFGGQRLLTLKNFPQVGDVFLGEETERIRRFFRYLVREVKKRKSLFASIGAANLQDYCESTQSNLPTLVIVLEDYAAFYKVCQNRSLDFDDSLANLIRDSISYGIYFVLTMASPMELKSHLANVVSLAITFHLANPDYTAALGMPTGGLIPAPIPGRGLIKSQPPLEFQTALPVSGNSDPERNQALKALIDHMNQAWQGMPVPPSFPPIPEVIGLSQIVHPLDHWSPAPASDFASQFAISLDDPDQPFNVNIWDGPYFLVAGTPQSGKTTLLQSWMLSMADRFSPSQLHLYLVDFRRSGLLGLSDLPHVLTPLLSQSGEAASFLEEGRYITDEDRFGMAMNEINKIMLERQKNLEEARMKLKGSFNPRVWLASQPMVVLVIDDYDVFEADVQPSVKDVLNINLKKWRDLGFFLIVAGSISDFEKSYGWAAQLFNSPVGFQMGTAAYTQIFKINNLPAENPSKHLLPGEAFYIKRGQYNPIKIADAQIGPLTISNWVENILSRTQTN